MGRISWSWSCRLSVSGKLEEDRCLLISSCWFRFVYNSLTQSQIWCLLDLHLNRNSWGCERYYLIHHLQLCIKPFEDDEILLALPKSFWCNGTGFSDEETTRCSSLGVIHNMCLLWNAMDGSTPCHGTQHHPTIPPHIYGSHHHQN